MADETTPRPTDETASGGGTTAGPSGVTPPKRRPRRATSPTTAPAPAGPAEPAPSGAASSAPAAAPPAPEPAPAEDTAPADGVGVTTGARRKRSTAPRRKTTGAVDTGAGGDEPADGATSDASTPAATASDGAAVETTETTQEPDVAPRTAGRARSARSGQRSRRRTADDAAEAAASGEESTDPAGSPETAEPAPGRPARGRGRTSHRAAKASVEVVDSAAPEPEHVADVPAGTAVEPSADVAPALDVLAELGPPKEQPTTTGGQNPRLAATALLFQAPEPRRRRRAQAPAGPPVAPAEEDEETISAADEVAADEIVEDMGPDAAEGEVTPDEQDEASSAHDADEDHDEAEDGGASRRRRRRRGGRGRRTKEGREHQEDGDRSEGDDEDDDHSAGTTDEDEQTSDQGDEPGDGEEGSGSSSRRRRRRRSRSGESGGEGRESRGRSDEVTALKGSTRLEAKRQRRREGRDAGRRRAVITEAEFLARRESVDRAMVVRESEGRIQIAVLEDDVLVEHFVARTGKGAASTTPSTTVGNIYLGRVQNVLPSMEAAFVDVGKGRNAVLYAGEVNWDAAGLEGQPRRIEQALKSGDSVLVQVTKDPIGHKGARLTSQITLAGRYLVYVPGGGMTGISRKLPDTERARLKKLLKEIVPDDAGVIVRTAAEGASDEELRRDVQRLQDQWAAVQKKAKSASAPALLHGEPDLAIRVVRDIFNDDFGSLVVQGDAAYATIADYVSSMAPDLADRVSRWTGTGDVFAEHRIDEQLAKALDRKVWLPSGGSLVIDRTEAMTVVDVNTGKFTGSGGTLEETVTRNNLEAAEEIVRQLRLRDIGGMIVVDFIDMVLESNRDLVLRRLVECLGRDRTKHQVAEVTSLGLVQMTRKRVGQGLVEAFSETCEHCNGRGYLIHSEPLDKNGSGEPAGGEQSGETRRTRRKKGSGGGGGNGNGSSADKGAAPAVPVLPEAREAVKATLATIAAAAAHAHEQAHHDDEQAHQDDEQADVEALPDPAATGSPAAEVDLQDSVAGVEALEDPASPVVTDGEARG